VEPDWDALDESWAIKKGQYFDCNGLRVTPNELCLREGLAAGEEPHLIMVFHLRKACCSCFWEVRSQLDTTAALMDHYLTWHGCYMCYACCRSFRDPVQLHVHLKHFHSFPANDFYCSAGCRRDYLTPVNLNRHFASYPHCKKKVVHCQIGDCGEGFQSQAETMSHHAKAHEPLMNGAGIIHHVQKADQMAALVRRNPPAYAEFKQHIERKLKAGQVAGPFYGAGRSTFFFCFRNVPVGLTMIVLMKSGEGLKAYVCQTATDRLAAGQRYSLFDAAFRYACAQRAIDFYMVIAP